MVWIKVSWSGRRQPQNGANRSLNLWNMESHGTISNWRIGKVCIYYNKLQATTAASTLVILNIYIIRNIGLSNYNLQGIREVVSYAKIKPAVLQIVSILT